MIKSILSDTKSKQLKPYNSNITKLISQTQKLNTALTQLKSTINVESVTIEQSLQFVFLKNKIDRNTRIVKAYKFYRYKKIQDQIFEHKSFSDKMLEGMCDVDQEYKVKFEKLYDTYRNEFCIDFDLEVPVDFCVSVIAVCTCGSILVDDELVEIEKNKLYFIKKKYVKHLIDAGKMKII
ncbi:hypothetical protein COBT_001107 [Conglomerata obtusa]